MKRKYKSTQRLLGYHVYFNTIKDSNGQTVAKIKRHQIVTNDDLFFKSVLSSNTIIDVSPKELKDRKIKYTLYNEQTKQIFAKADSFFNIYNLENSYLGSFFNSTKSIIFIIRCTIFAILALFISFVSLQTTGNSTKPKELVVSEIDGGIISDEWNIFGSQIGDKILYPGKIGEYYFSITNPNQKDIVMSIEFAENNKDQLPIVYRLVCKNEYLCGETNNWIHINELYANEILIKANQTIQFRLDWNWKNSDNDEFDTQLGIDNKATYTLFVTITSILIYPNHQNNL
ncbi:MAG: hypothetical protein ACLUG4_06095 [Bacilli bacterium]|jgi:hypothetical protein|nr:hypothetical protein [Staphylococcus sp.]